MSTLPVRLDRLQVGLVAWIQARLPSATVLIAPSSFPRAAEAGGLVVTVKTLGGPSGSPLGGMTRTTRLVPDTATIRVLAATAGEDVKLTASGLAWEYRVQAGDDVEAVRDGLFALVGASVIRPFSLALDGTDGFVLTEVDSGDLYNVAVHQSIAAQIVVESQTTVACRVSVESVRTLVEVETWSRDVYPRSGALAAMMQLTSTRRLYSVETLLDSYGLSIETMPAPVDLSSMSGPTWQSRANLSFYVHQVALAAEPIELIERVRVTMNVQGTAPDVATVAIDTEPPP